MLIITHFEPGFEELLPVSHALCESANLVVHESVERVVLVGSRGLAGGYRPDSDIDLTLIVAAREIPQQEPEREYFLRNVLEITLSQWRGTIELDTAAIFDTFTCCGLRCYQARDYDPAIIKNRGKDCFGLYKIQRGFNGYVRQGIDVARVYPMLCIWRRP